MMITGMRIIGHAKGIITQGILVDNFPQGIIT
jgi:hypothetical protein